MKKNKGVFLDMIHEERFQEGKEVRYIRNPKPCWCKVHHRPATYILQRFGMKDVHVCDPRLGGIDMFCMCKHDEEE